MTFKQLLESGSHLKNYTKSIMKGLIPKLDLLFPILIWLLTAKVNIVPHQSITEETVYSI